MMTLQELFQLMEQIAGSRSRAAVSGQDLVSGLRGTPLANGPFNSGSFSGTRPEPAARSPYYSSMWNQLGRPSPPATPAPWSGQGRGMEGRPDLRSLIRSRPENPFTSIRSNPNFFNNRPPQF